MSVDRNAGASSGEKRAEADAHDQLGVDLDRERDEKAALASRGREICKNCVPKGRGFLLQPYLDTLRCPGCGWIKPPFVPGVCPACMSNMCAKLSCLRVRVDKLEQDKPAPQSDADHRQFYMGDASRPAERDMAAIKGEKLRELQFRIKAAEQNEAAHAVEFLTKIAALEQRVVHAEMIARDADVQGTKALGLRNRFEDLVARVEGLAGVVRDAKERLDSLEGRSDAAAPPLTGDVWHREPEMVFMSLGKPEDADKPISWKIRERHAPLCTECGASGVMLADYRANTGEGRKVCHPCVKKLVSKGPLGPRRTRARDVLAAPARAVGKLWRKTPRAVKVAAALALACVAGNLAWATAPAWLPRVWEAIGR